MHVQALVLLAHITITCINITNQTWFVRLLVHTQYSWALCSWLFHFPGNRIVTLQCTCQKIGFDYTFFRKLHFPFMVMWEMFQWGFPSWDFPPSSKGTVCLSLACCNGFHYPEHKPQAHLHLQEKAVHAFCSVLTSNLVCLQFKNTVEYFCPP